MCRKQLSGSELAFRDLSPSTGSRAQLTEISKIIYRRLSTSIAPKRMVLTVNLTVKFFSVF